MLLRIICILFISSPVIWSQSSFGQTTIDSAGIELPIRLKSVIISYDLASFANKITEPQRNNYMVQLSADIQRDYMPIVELGTGNLTKSVDSLYNYKSNDSYFKLGVDFNNRGKNNDIIGFGLRYGTGWGKYQLSDIFPANDYSNTIILNPNEEYHVFTQWIEVLFSVKVEVAKYVYLGWSARGKIRLFKIDDDPYPYLMDGYGRMDKKAVAGLNYYIGIRIPL